MYLPLSEELKCILDEINKIPETPMNDEFWNTPEMLEAACVDLDTDGGQCYTFNLSTDGKTCRQVDRYEKYDARTNVAYCSHVTINVLVGPELFGRIDRLYNDAVRRRYNHINQCS